MSIIYLKFNTYIFIFIYIILDMSDSYISLCLTYLLIKYLLEEYSISPVYIRFNAQMQPVYINF